MTNYMGKNRLITLFYHYISDRTEYMKAFKAAVCEYGKEIMFDYRKYHGNEWLECWNDGHKFKIYVFGQASKTIVMEEKQYNEALDNYVQSNRIISYYDDTFLPKSDNKDKSLDCYTLTKRQQN